MTQLLFMLLFIYDVHDTRSIYMYVLKGKTIYLDEYKQLDSYKVQVKRPPS